VLLVVGLILVGLVSKPSTPVARPPTAEDLAARYAAEKDAMPIVVTLVSLAVVALLSAGGILLIQTVRERFGNPATPEPNKHLDRIVEWFKKT
jgi:hypothetical protein